MLGLTYAAAPSALVYHFRGTMAGLVAFAVLAPLCTFIVIKIHFRGYEIQRKLAEQEKRQRERAVFRLTSSEIH